MTTTIYTDGSCIGNPGAGGWAWAVNDELKGSGFAPDTTNNRMEIQAVIEALRACADPDVVIVSDSKYVVDCFEQGWHRNWVRNGWRNSQKQAVANRDLWEELLLLVAAKNVRFEWVKGHSTSDMNNLVDRMARKEAEESTDIPAWCGKCGAVGGVDPRPMRVRRADPCEKHS